MAEDEPDQQVVEKFRQSGALEDGAMPVASLQMLWYLEDDGEDAVLSKFDGKQRVSTTIGDLVALIHEYLHQDQDDE